MSCSVCGRENRPGAGFCAWCGSPIASPMAAGQRDARLPEHDDDAEVGWKTVGGCGPGVRKPAMVWFVVPS